jgi:hypothetical protein
VRAAVGQHISLTLAQKILLSNQLPLGPAQHISLTYLTRNPDSTSSV